MALYGVSFPRHEQRAVASQCDILENREYHFDLIYDDAENLFVGILLFWETNDFIYIEHFCVEPLLRNRNYGQKSLALLQEKGKTIILEIDPVVDEISRKRKGFYERAGFVENVYLHVHPAYHAENEGHGLIVMSFPRALGQAEYDAFDSYLRNTVMGGAQG